MQGDAYEYDVTRLFLYCLICISFTIDLKHLCQYTDNVS